MHGVVGRVLKVRRFLGCGEEFCVLSVSSIKAENDGRSMPD